MSPTRLLVLQRSLESLQRKHDVMRTALEFMREGPPQGQPIQDPWTALHSAISQPLYRNLTGGELEDITIMWRAHLIDTVGA